jgi:hypothetical protein
MRGALVLLLAVSACAGSKTPPPAMTRDMVPRDARGDAVLAAIPPAPPPEPPPPAEFKPVTQQPVDCSHLRHC